MTYLKTVSTGSKYSEREDFFFNIEKIIFLKWEEKNQMGIVYFTDKNAIFLTAPQFNQLKYQMELHYERNSITSFFRQLFFWIK